jgi:hypothetical protein
MVIFQQQLEGTPAPDLSSFSLSTRYHHLTLFGLVVAVHSFSDFWIPVVALVYLSPSLPGAEDSMSFRGV